MYQERKPMRLQNNTNLKLYYELTYRGLPLVAGHSPFIEQYLDKLHLTISDALAEHPRLFAVRVDLHLPVGLPLPGDSMTNRVMDRLTASLKAKIRHDRNRAKQKGGAHDTTVRYVWAREIETSDNQHYHFLLLLNRDAYNWLGNVISDYENTYSRIRSAWASALGLTWSETGGLVHIPKNPEYRVDRGAGLEGLYDLFHRASYLCKASTKAHGGYAHGFGCSRRRP